MINSIYSIKLETDKGYTDKNCREHGLKTAMQEGYWNKLGNKDKVVNHALDETLSYDWMCSLNPSIILYPV